MKKTWKTNRFELIFNFFGGSLGQKWNLLATGSDPPPVDARDQKTPSTGLGQGNYVFEV